MEEQGKEIFSSLICELKGRERLMECRFFCWFVLASPVLDGREKVKCPYPTRPLSRAVDYFNSDPLTLGFLKLQVIR